MERWHLAGDVAEGDVRRLYCRSQTLFVPRTHGRQDASVPSGPWRGRQLNPCGSLVGDRSAGRAGEMHHLGSFEAHFLTPPVKIRTGEIECVAELDQHI